MLEQGVVEAATASMISDCSTKRCEPTCPRKCMAAIASRRRDHAATPAVPAMAQGECVQRGMSGLEGISRQNFVHFTLRQFVSNESWEGFSGAAATRSTLSSGQSRHERRRRRDGFVTDRRHDFGLGPKADSSS